MMNEAKKLKEQLYDYCFEYAMTRLQTVQAALKEARESANDENKSSAGDKHETGRSMAQLEQEKLSYQLSEAKKLLDSVHLLERGKISTLIASGTLIVTDKGNYFISVSAGKFVINKEVYFAVSPASPIGTTLLNLKGTHTFNFNDSEYRIKKIS